MSELSLDEVTLGIVAFLDPGMLHHSNSVERTMPETIARPGPYACVAIDGDYSWWVPLTTRALTNSGYARLHIPSKDRSGTHPQWINVEQYLYDGASIYFGPTQEFCAASYREITRPDTRSLISSDALHRIHAELERQVGRREKELTRAP